MRVPTVVMSSMSVEVCILFLIILLVDSLDEMQTPVNAAPALPFMSVQVLYFTSFVASAVKQFAPAYNFVTK